MNFWQSVISCLSKYTESRGRASRSEYWYFTLFNLVVALVAEAIGENISLATALAFLLPSVMVSIRRLHDVDRSGWWLASSVTIVAIPLLIYWACQPGGRGPNRFGPDPLQHDRQAEAAA